MAVLVGRDAERQVLTEAAGSPDAELVAIYGRRRVGKTFLIRETYGRAVCFELVGSHGVTLALQLREFAAALARAMGVPTALTPPHHWQEAFDQLRAFLTARLPRHRAKQVVFF